MGAPAAQLSAVRCPLWPLCEPGKTLGPSPENEDLPGSGLRARLLGREGHAGAMDHLAIGANQVGNAAAPARIQVRHRKP